MYYELISVSKSIMTTIIALIVLGIVIVDGQCQPNNEPLKVKQGDH